MVGKRHAKGTYVEPKHPKAELALRIVEHTVNLIEKHEPSAFVIENPRAMMRHAKCLHHLERRTVTYCQLGKHYMKPTDVWGGFPTSLVLPEPCKNGMPCHEAAPRGAKTGTQGLKNSAERAVIPYRLSELVAEACERDYLP